MRVLLVLLLFPSLLYAQGPLVGNRLELTPGSCRLRTGTGSPEGILVGHPCDTYLNITDGVFWAKWAGNETNTGWNVGHNTNARINGTTTFTDYIGEPNYVSQLTTWRVTNAGAADFRYLFTDELHARVFIADLEQALAGLQIICKSVAVLGADFTNPGLGGTTSITLKDLPSAANMAVFQGGDYIGVRSFSRAGGGLTIAESFGTVKDYGDGANGIQTWSFTRGAGVHGGTMAGGTIIGTDAIVIDYGTTGNGCHEINAIDGQYGLNSPYAQTWTWTTSPISANRVLRTRLGNQRGITGVVNEYGLIAGAYAATNGQYIRASNTAVELHGVDLSLWQVVDGTPIRTFFVDHAVPSLSLGSAAPGGYNSGIGCWMGRDTADELYKFRCGTPGAAGMFWDGSALTIRAAGGSSVNQIRNSECRASTEDWTGGTTSGLSLTVGFALPTWTLDAQSNTCYGLITGTPANATQTELYTTALLTVIAGSRYEASNYLGVHRSGNTTTVLQWLGPTDNEISRVIGNVCTAATAGGAFLVNYCRSGVVATAPAGAVRARVMVNTTHNGSGANPYVFWVRSHFGEATAFQTQLSEWGPGGITEITGGMIRTGTIVAGHIAAGTITSTQIAAGTITADKLNVTSLSAISGDIGTITAGSISLNSGAFFLNANGNVFAQFGVFTNLDVSNNIQVLNLLTTNFSATGTASIGGGNTLTIFNLSGTGNRAICANSSGALIIC